VLIVQQRFEHFVDHGQVAVLFRKLQLDVGEIGGHVVK